MLLEEEELRPVGEDGPFPGEVNRVTALVRGDGLEVSERGEGEEVCVIGETGETGAESDESELLVFKPLFELEPFPVLWIGV